MELQHLDSSLRKNLRNLLEGYMEHCEFSHHLMARIDFPIYFHGFKFGAPVFTHSGSLDKQGAGSQISLVGLNTPRSSFPSEILLEVIEILARNPELAGDHTLHLMPVANPVALELGDYAPEVEEWPVLEHLVGEFREAASVGFMEIGLSLAGAYSLEGSVPASLFAALEKVKADAEKNRKIKLPEEIQLKPLVPGERWNVKLSIPEAGWSSQEIREAAVFITGLLAARPVGAQRSSADSNRSEPVCF